MFAWIDCGKPRNISVRIVIPPADIATDHLSNARQKRYHQKQLEQRHASGKKIELFPWVIFSFDEQFLNVKY
jgi:hypothetical protein